MRQILVDHARANRAEKRGGGAPKLALDADLAHSYGNGIDLLVLDNALRSLTKLNPQQGQIVELRFFSGLTIEDTSEVLGISPATVKRSWTAARAWLYREMNRGEAT
jgi:RNA polymerase sigma factor (TIGR02999 family)